MSFQKIYPGRVCVKFAQNREAPVQLRFGDGTVQAVPVFGSGGSSGFSVFQYSLSGKDGSGFGSWKTVPAVPVPLSVSGKTVPTVPVPVRFLSHPAKMRATKQPQKSHEKSTKNAQTLFFQADEGHGKATPFLTGSLPESTPSE